MKKVRFGIVGVGNMGSAHLQYLANNEISGAEVSAICDINAQRLTMAEWRGSGIHLSSCIQKLMPCWTAVKWMPFL